MNQIHCQRHRQDDWRTCRSPLAGHATFEAYGGDRAIEAERQGLTQKIRIQSRLSEVIRHEFGLPARADVRRYEIFVN